MGQPDAYGGKSSVIGALLIKAVKNDLCDRYRDKIANRARTTKQARWCSW